jgi:hypothetical protein
MFTLNKLCRGIAAAAMVFFASGAFAQAMSDKPFLDAEAAANDPDRPLWMRYPAISPDASRIAFSYHGQIWIVDASGGEAVPMTSGLFYSVQPVWSPDGSSIAFASDRYGNFDIFVMPSRGGRITRLTYHSSPDTPCAFSADGRMILFESVRLGNASVSYHNGLGNLSRQIYSVPVAGSSGPAQRGRSIPGVHQPPLDRAVLAQACRLRCHNGRLGLRHANETTPAAHRFPRRGQKSRVGRRRSDCILPQRAVGVLQRLEQAAGRFGAACTDNLPPGPSGPLSERSR